MQHDLTQYQTLVFDCDGVVLNSNEIKTQAFYEVAHIYGHEPALALKEYHVKNGGISRYAKLIYLITKILNKPIDQCELKHLLDNFSHQVKKALLNCDVADGLDQLKAKSPNANWLIVSGGDQLELREVFAERDLNKYFDGGIFGSPDTKDLILAREIENGNISKPALFFGDSKYDYQAAQSAGLDFVFLTQWTEVKNHRAWCSDQNIDNYVNIMSLL